MSQSKSQLVRSKRRARWGGAVLELALAAPVLTYIVFGAIEYGYCIYVKDAAFAAARDGVREAITPTATNATVSSAVANSMNLAGFSYIPYTVTTSPSNITTATSGSTVSVTISYTWGSVNVHPLPTVMGGISPTKSLTVAAAMRKE